MASGLNGHNKGPVQQPVTPLECLLPQSGGQIALIQLNLDGCTTPGYKDILTTLWEKAALRACADGGANSLYETMATSNEQDKYIPHFISGDFDSARKEVLDFYRNQGCEVVATPDQDYTDFTKCLQLVVERIKNNHHQVDCIVAVAANAMSRFDHILANVNTLYEAKNITDIPVILIAGMSLVYLLSPGQHTLQVSTGLEAKWCGLLPIGVPCKNVTTTGLKWNLSHDTLEFGTLVSTSNTYADNTVTVETDQPLLWTMGIKL